MHAAVSDELRQELREAGSAIEKGIAIGTLTSEISAATYRLDAVISFRHLVMIATGVSAD
jgi:hypothetical protein